MARDDTLDAGQADAGAGELGRRMQALEHAEQLVRIGHVEPGAVVADAEPVAAVGLVVVRDLDHRRLAARAVLDRVAQQVQPDLAQPVLVRSEEQTSELQSLMRLSYAVFSLE